MSKLYPGAHPKNAQLKIWKQVIGAGTNAAIKIAPGTKINDDLVNIFQAIYSPSLGS